MLALPKAAQVWLVLLLAVSAPPMVAQTPADRPVSVDREGFDDWGLLGLLGLAGLLGLRHRNRTLVDTRRP
jgi:MYXO-CTERM domain-containing protein